MSNLTKVKKYPLDLTAVSRDNRVVREPHLIVTDKDRVIILNSGPFYSKTIVIELVGASDPLQYGRDYVFNYLHEEATERSSKPVYGVIIIKDAELVGTLLVSAQLVGGQYADNHSAIEQALKDIQETEGDIYWEKVLNKPLHYPPMPHRHTMDDLGGVVGIVTGLNEIAGAITGERPSKLDELRNELETKVSNNYAVKRASNSNGWLLTEDNPLRIKIHGHPGTINVELAIWDDVKGFSRVDISGKLTAVGVWELRDYMVSVGRLPSIECLLTHLDGVSAELLVRSTGESGCRVILKSHTHLTHVPKDNMVEFLALDTEILTNADTFVKPIYTWNI